MRRARALLSLLRFPLRSRAFPLVCTLSRSLMRAIPIRKPISVSPRGTVRGCAVRARAFPPTPSLARLPSVHARARDSCTGRASAATVAAAGADARASEGDCGAGAAAGAALAGALDARCGEEGAEPDGAGGRWDEAGAAGVARRREKGGNGRTRPRTRDNAIAWIEEKSEPAGGGDVAEGSGSGFAL